MRGWHPRPGDEDHVNFKLEGLDEEDDGPRRFVKCEELVKKKSHTTTNNYNHVTHVHHHYHGEADVVTGEGEVGGQDDEGGVEGGAQADEDGVRREDPPPPHGRRRIWRTWEHRQMCKLLGVKDRYGKGDIFEDVIKEIQASSDPVYGKWRFSLFHQRHWEENL